MDLEPNGVDRGFVNFIMDECWDMRPASLDAYFLEVLVEGDARIALNTHKCPVLASIEYDRLDYATVCDDRLLQLFEGSAFRTARLVIVPSTQCQEYLVWRRILSVHFEKFADAWVRPVEFDVIDYHRLVFASTDQIPAPRSCSLRRGTISGDCNNKLQMRHLQRISCNARERAVGGFWVRFPTHGGRLAESPQAQRKGNLVSAMR